MGTQKGFLGIAELFGTYGNYRNLEGLIGNCRITGIMGTQKDLLGIAELYRTYRNYGKPEGQGNY